MSLRAIGREIGIKNASTVKYHRDQLEDQNLLVKPRKPQIDKFLRRIRHVTDDLINIPILGTVNCGVATMIAEEMIEGYLKVSPKLLPTRNQDALFAVRAEGNSMNKANINGLSVEEGDYLIVDTNNTRPQSGKNYVLSIIEGCANIKKFYKNGNMIILTSESTEEHLPVYIHEDDDYLINGVVVQVIKKPIGGDN